VQGKAPQRNLRGFFIATRLWRGKRCRLLRPTGAEGSFLTGGRTGCSVTLPPEGLFARH